MLFWVFWTQMDHMGDLEELWNRLSSTLASALAVFGELLSGGAS